MKKITKNTHRRLSITLPEYLINELDFTANELNDKKSRLIAKALSYYFDALDETIADLRLKKLEQNESRTIPADKVWEELGV